MEESQPRYLYYTLYCTWLMSSLYADGLLIGDTIRPGFEEIWIVLYSCTAFQGILQRDAMQ